MKKCNNCKWKGMCSTEFYYGGCEGKEWTQKEEGMNNDK